MQLLLSGLRKRSAFGEYTVFFVCLPEVVSKRWHNLIYILSSAIFSFGYATFSSCIWQQVAIFQLYRVINSPINIYLATVMSPFPSFYQFSTHFFDIKGYSKESKVHCNLVFSHMPESSVCHVVFHLSKHRLWFYTPPASMLDTFF